MIFLAAWLCDLTLLGEVFPSTLKHPEVLSAITGNNVACHSSKQQQILATIKPSATEATLEDGPRGEFRMEKNRVLAPDS